ncbi:unnamed protein product [Prunus armeniaca]
MVRSMLVKKRYLEDFLIEAVNWSVHVLNRSPTLAVKNITPQEAWNEVRPSVDHFRIFGCIAYAHVPDEKRTKLNDKSVKCLYSENTWDWSNTKQQQILIDLEEAGGEIIQPLQPPLESQGSESQLQLPGQSLGEVSPSSSASVSIPNEVQAPSLEPQRQRKRPSWMIDCVSGDELSYEDTTTHFILFAGSDPILFAEAVKEEKWKKAIDADIQAIEKNETWELTDLPKGQKTISVKWVYKKKLNEKGEIDKFKARLVVKGYNQEHGANYQEIFAPVARQDTIRLVLDVKSAFLNGELLEQVYIEQPPSYVIKEAYFKEVGFNKCPYEHTLFIKFGEGGRILIVCLYVDDLIFMGNDKPMFIDFKNSMMADFDMTNLGKMKYYLGIEVVQTAIGFFIGQKKYAQEVLERFHMKNCNLVGTPTEPGLKLSSDLDGERVDSTYFKQIVGSLMYLTATQPDIMYAVCLISRYMERQTELHLRATKRVFRYLKGTIDFGIFYKKNGGPILTGFTDSDYAGDLDDR